jgi:hypothetical protein
MNHVGQHYIHRTPLCVAAGLTEAADGSVRALMTHVGAGDNTTLFRITPTGSTGKDAFRFESKPLNTTSAPLEHAVCIKDVFVGAAGGDVTMITNADGAVVHVSSRTVSHTRISALTAAGNVAVYGTAGGAVGIFDPQHEAVVLSTTAVDTLGALPITALADAGPTGVLAVCRHVVSFVDYRNPRVVARAWRWNAGDLLRCVSSSSARIVCGSEEGTVALFDWRNSAAVGHAVASPASVIAGAALFDDACFVTASANGLMKLWRQTGESELALPFAATTFSPDPTLADATLGAAGVVVSTAVVRNAGLLFAADDSGMLDVFAL